MAVVLVDGTYTVRRRPHPTVRDGHGLPVPGSDVFDIAGPVDGAAKQTPEGAWTLRLDPSVWPVRSGDVVVRTADNATWTVNGEPNLTAVPGVPDVDYVSLTARLNTPDPDRGQP